MRDEEESEADNNEPESSAEKLLVYKKEAAWKRFSDEEKQQVRDLAEQYRLFLTKAKTERLCIEEAVTLAQNAGFREYVPGESLQPGNRVYLVNRKKNAIFAVIGETPMTEKVHLVASHVDCPRIDLKVNPNYQDSGLALFKTHYYGGIKKYQWVNVPFQLHGVVVRRDGTLVTVSVGENPDDPVFVIPDLLIHLATKKQGQRKMDEVIMGEELNAIAGSLPAAEEKAKEEIKLNLLQWFNDQYGIVEEDFLSAELSLVPAMEARYVGVDKGMVGGYGHDDRVCSFAGLASILAVTGIPSVTALMMHCDKEEIGSVTNTGAQSAFLEQTLGEFLQSTGVDASVINLNRALKNTFAISADVGAAIDPSFKDVHDTHTSPIAGQGVGVTKYTGSGGKRGANDAHAEVVGAIRKLFNDQGVPWQVDILGKVDEGGGGTIAQFLSMHNMEVIDIGTPVLGMHSPFELVHIADIYATFKGYKVFFESNL
ncbi:MAG TPA: aminopeptidase [Candidatus Lokiarchaeia archaeon]|nr:aminopeptidase [Candidatus Lokiarchaeia archaeon]